MSKVKNFGKFINEGGVKYPYQNRKILVLLIEYSKGGLNQQSSIQFNDGKVFTKEISVDYLGVVKFPDNVETMEDVVDFIYDLSYSPRNFVKIISVKYPSYISPHTTHLLNDVEEENKITQYLKGKQTI